MKLTGGRFRLDLEDPGTSSCKISIWNSWPQDPVIAMGLDDFKRELDKLIA